MYVLRKFISFTNNLNTCKLQRTILIYLCMPTYIQLNILYFVARGAIISKRICFIIIKVFAHNNVIFSLYFQWVLHKWNNATAFIKNPIEHVDKQHTHTFSSIIDKLPNTLVEWSKYTHYARMEWIEWTNQVYLSSFSSRSSIHHSQLLLKIWMALSPRVTENQQ